MRASAREPANPVQTGQTITISLEEQEMTGIDWRIWTNSGKVIRRGNGLEIKVDGILAGMYFVEIRNERGQKGYKKLLIQ